MKKLGLVSFFLFFIALFAFSEPENPEEIDHLLFLPDESRQFVNEAEAMIQLDNLARYLLGKNLNSGQIYVYGYAAFAVNDVDPVNLSRDRALFVIGELQRRGVSRNLFSDPVGHGSVSLWGRNTDEDDRSPNRRVRVILDGNIVTPETIKEPATIPETLETIKESEPEIVISSADDREPVSQEAAAEKSGAKFPLWLLFLLLLLVLIAALIYLLSRRKKSPSTKPAAPVKTKPVKVKPVKVKPVKTKPVKTEPVKAKPIIAEPVKVEPAKAAPAAATANITKPTVILDEEIRRRAYELYQERGSQHGNMAGDWYDALNDVCAKYKSAGYRIYFEGDHWWAS
jgi:cbb3-type cytochrome oxidase subunit 3